ncbi:MFS transporter [Streptomyces griseoruber]|uniref:MFS transporter n=1 Tax=Streptomyces griseoruber TaxID=1943 RepID=A0A101SWC0_9ACTN|nr:MFS transporter [Streptomyces griseoruber]KUN81317.1 MFS transporter [Streptomyces griseoruber]
MTIQSENSWRPRPVTNRQITYATVLAFLAWAFAVYDFILFGILLPEIGKDQGLDSAEQATLVTWMSIGAVVLGLLAGPVVDKFGRKAGVAVTTAGAGVASALTALAGVVPAWGLVAIRSLSGLGLSEQGVNGAYLSELYGASDDPRIKKRQGFIYSLVQGGWPVGAILAAALTAVMLPIIGWAGCFLFAAVPSLVIALLARKLRESPQFETVQKLRQLQSLGARREAEQLAVTLGVEESETRSTLADILRGSGLRTTLSLGLGHILNYFPVQVFSVLGTTVLINVHHVSFTNSLVILLMSNVIAYLGYLTHGFLGDRFGRRNVIAAGWVTGGLVFTAMIYGPSNFWTVVALYSIGTFFLIGPYSCVLFFVGESYETRIRGRGAAFVAAVGPIGAILSSALAATLLSNHGTWATAAFLFGAVPCTLSGLAVLFSRKRQSVAAPVRAGRHARKTEPAI